MKFQRVRLIYIYINFLVANAAADESGRVEGDDHEAEAEGNFNLDFLCSFNF